MAIYHCRLKVTGQFVRPKGGASTGTTRRSSVAAAAYRSGETLFDNQQGKWCSRKAKRLREVKHTTILAPASAIRLVEDFATEQFVDKGMVADIAIHESAAADGKLNTHAHIMLTMRRLETDPARAAVGHFFASKRERDWDCPEAIVKQISFANKKRDGALERFERTGDERYLQEADDWKAKRDALDAARPVNEIRRAWEAAANRSLNEVGSSARIDHRTLVAQREEALQNGDMARAAELNRDPLPRLSPLAKHIAWATGVILDRQNVYRAASAAREFWRSALSMAGIDRKRRAQVFLKVTETTDVLQHLLCLRFVRPGFLFHLRSLRLR